MKKQLGVTFLENIKSDFGLQVQSQQNFNPFRRRPQTDGPLKNTKGRKQARFSEFDQQESDLLKSAETN